MAWTTAFRRSLRLASLLTMCATGIATCVHAQESDVQRGFAIAPVPVDVAGKNPALVGRGSYLVNAIGNCNDCHTHPSYTAGGDPYSGEPERINVAQYLSGGRAFGPFVAPNLTPDANGKPAGLSYEQFVVTLRTGHNPLDPPRPPLQVMPWPGYAKMVDLDFRAIYEYLRAIPSLPDNPNPGP